MKVVVFFMSALLHVLFSLVSLPGCFQFCHWHWFIVLITLRCVFLIISHCVYFQPSCCVLSGFVIVRLCFSGLLKFSGSCYDFLSYFCICFFSVYVYLIKLCTDSYHQWMQQKNKFAYIIKFFKKLILICFALQSVSIVSMFFFIVSINVHFYNQTLNYTPPLYNLRSLLCSQRQYLIKSTIKTVILCVKTK